MFLATARLIAEPLQQEVPYFVDAAGREYDLELESSLYDKVRASQGDRAAVFRMASLRLQRWRVFLRSDGTWVPDPSMGLEDYADQHYPVEYVLPLGYRGAFQVAWDVRGAPPLQIVNDKIEIYIPASGLFETSSALALTYGAVASAEHQFYFEHDNKRTVIPHEPLLGDEVGISYGTTSCRGMPNQCYSYFVGSREEWHTAQSVKCPKGTTEGAASGIDCSDVPPGSTQPVSQIIPPHGRLAIMHEFHGRTLNGRRVVLSTDPPGTTTWRYDGPEPNVPDESTLAMELKSYIEAISKRDASSPMALRACTPEQAATLLRVSTAGPYRFFRTPYSSKILGWFNRAEKSTDRTVYQALIFSRSEQGWKLLACNCDFSWRQSETISRLDTKISRFVGKGELQKSTPVVLREDGTWDSDDPEQLGIPEYTVKFFKGRDMNGGKIDFTRDGHGRGAWRRESDQVLPLSADTIISELNRALDRYIELLSAGNVEGFLAESGGQGGDAFEFYRTLQEFGDDSEQANDLYDFLRRTGDGERLIQQYGESHFKSVVKKWLLEGAIQNVDRSFLLQEFKRLRNETPRIAPPKPFSPDFEAIYILPPKETGQPQAVRRMIGQGPKWAFHSE